HSGLSCIGCRALAASETRRSFAKTRTPPKGASAGGVSGTLRCGRYEGLSYEGSASQTRGRAKSSSRNVVLWDFCDTWRIFLPDHIAGRFSCSNVTIRTRRGACGMGVETILLIVILAFAAGFVLDRWGHQARPLRRCEIEEGTVSDFTTVQPDMLIS